MPTDGFLTNFTQQGIENVHDSPDRAEAAESLVESMGGTWKEFFVTMGRYNGLVVADFPDDATAARAVLTLAKGGNVTTETLRAFTLGSSTISSTRWRWPGNDVEPSNRISQQKGYAPR